MIKSNVCLYSQGGVSKKFRSLRSIIAFKSTTVYGISISFKNQSKQGLVTAMVHIKFRLKYRHMYQHVFDKLYRLKQATLT